MGARSLADAAWPNFFSVATWLMTLHLVFGYFKLDTRQAGRRGGAEAAHAPAAGAVAALKRDGIRTVMLTGDHPQVAEAVANALGLDEVHAELLPAEKVAVIERLQAGGGQVAMVGDGVNDAPALAQADVGIALGTGTDVAIESAGVILVRDRVENVVAALRIGRAASRRMTERRAGADRAPGDASCADAVGLNAMDPRSPPMRSLPPTCARSRRLRAGRS